MEFRHAICTVDDVIRQVEIGTDSDNNLATSIDTLITTKYANQILWIKELIYEVSEQLSEWRGQSFIPYHATYSRKLRTVAANRELNSYYSDLRLYLAWTESPLLAVNSLTWNGASMASSTYQVGDGSTSASEYLMLDPDQSWDLASTSFASDVDINGVWGYHYNYSKLWTDSGDTVQDNPLSDSATTLNVTDGGNFETYQYIQIEDEWLFITSISTNALTVERGALGTTAASHVQTTQIDVMRPDDSAVSACRRLVVLRYKNPDETADLVLLPDGTIQLGTTQQRIPLPKMRYGWVSA